MDRRTRKILACAMNGCPHTRSNVARLYLPRKEGGRGLIGIEECVRRESKSLHGYQRESTEWMLQAALKEKVIVEERVCRTMRGGGNTRKLKTGRRKPYMVRLSDKYQMKLERSLEDGSGMDS